MTGSLEGAIKASKRELPFCGEGSFREVFLDSDAKVVYKIEHHEEGYLTHDANVEEYESWQALKTMVLPEDIRIPDATLYNVNGENIIAMDYIVGDRVGECWCTADEECDDDCLTYDVIEYLSKHTGLDDFAWGNIIRANGVYWMIDLQA